MGTQPPTQKGQSLTQFSVYVYCGQTAAWIKMAFGTEVWASAYATLCSMWTQLPQKKGHPHPHPIFGHDYGQMAGWMN